VVSEKGIGKRTNLDEFNEETKEWEEIYRITNRGGKGVKTLNVTPKTGKLIGFLAVDETDDLFITCVSGVTIRTHVKNIRAAGRATQGVKLINLDEGDEIAAVAKIAEQEEEADEIVDETSVIEGDTIEASSEIQEKTDESTNETGESTQDDNNPITEPDSE